MDGVLVRASGQLLACLSRQPVRWEVPDHPHALGHGVEGGGSSWRQRPCSEFRFLQVRPHGGVTYISISSSVKWERCSLPPRPAVMVNETVMLNRWSL